jgi:Phage terminase, small subunit
MAGPGRKPFTAVERTDTVSYGLPDPRLRPPASLGEAERRVFIDLVTSCPSGQFAPSDTPMLALWATITVQLEQAAGELAAGGMVVDGKASAWFDVQQRAAKTLAMLALRLRLSPQSRTRMAPKTKPAALSYYDRQRLEGGDGEDDADEAHRN